MVGMKMGLTSWAKMKQMGVEQPCYGFLADYFSLPDGAQVETKELIHPKVEAELALVTKKVLKGQMSLSKKCWTQLMWWYPQ